MGFMNLGKNFVKFRLRESKIRQNWSSIKIVIDTLGFLPT